MTPGQEVKKKKSALTVAELAREGVVDGGSLLGAPY